MEKRIRWIKSDEEAHSLLLFNLSRRKIAQDETSGDTLISSRPWILTLFFHPPRFDWSARPDGISSHLAGNINYSQSVLNSLADVRSITHQARLGRFSFSCHANHMFRVRWSSGNGNALLKTDSVSVYRQISQALGIIIVRYSLLSDHTIFLNQWFSESGCLHDSLISAIQN